MVRVQQKNQPNLDVKNSLTGESNEEQSSQSITSNNLRIPLINGVINASIENNKLSEGVLSAEIPAIITADTTSFDRQICIDKIA